MARQAGLPSEEGEARARAAASIQKQARASTPQERADADYGRR